MSEDDTSSANNNKDSSISLLLTKDGQAYYVDKSGVVDSRNVVTPQESENNMYSYDMDDPDEESDVLDTSDPRDSAPSPDDPNDEEAFGENENVSKSCTYEGCPETTNQVAKQRKPWMCKKHRNKMYKDKYKKKKSDQAMSSGKLEVGTIDCFVAHTTNAINTLPKNKHNTTKKKKIIILKYYK